MKIWKTKNYIIPLSLNIEYTVDSLENRSVLHYKKYADEWKKQIDPGF